MDKSKSDNPSSCDITSILLILLFERSRVSRFLRYFKQLISLILLPDKSKYSKLFKFESKLILLILLFDKFKEYTLFGIEIKLILLISLSDKSIDSRLFKFDNGVTSLIAFPAKLKDFKLWSLARGDVSFKLSPSIDNSIKFVKSRNPLIFVKCVSHIWIFSRFFKLDNASKSWILSPPIYSIDKFIKFDKAVISWTCGVCKNNPSRFVRPWIGDKSSTLVACSSPKIRNLRKLTAYSIPVNSLILS